MQIAGCGAIRRVGTTGSPVPSRVRILGSNAQSTRAGSKVCVRDICAKVLAYGLWLFVFAVQPSPAISSVNAAPGVAGSTVEENARGRTHALLVGVSDYPYLDAGAQLLGPRNDVELWRDYLVESRPDASVQVLADGIDRAAMPTRHNIMQALSRLAGEADDGDFVFLMFAGHGAQQPASDRSLRDEPDGLDEIFLPRDVRGWDNTQASVENAIIDTEFKQAIDRIRDKGAFVWAVFDTCHSATMTRAVAPSSVRYRQLTPMQLGIPVESLQSAKTRSAGWSSSMHSPDAPRAQTPAGMNDSSGVGSGQRATGASSGQMVAFYAAQSHQVTPEFALPLGAIDARDHGVFSYALLQALRDAPQASYSELIERVMQRLQVMPGASAVPMAEGTAMADQVWGGQAPAADAWRVSRNGDRLTLAAGRMHDQTPGSTLKLYSSPAADESSALGAVIVTQARALDSDVKLIDPGEHERTSENAPATMLANLPDLMYARSWQTQVDWRLKVALAPAGQAQCQAPTPMVVAALERARQLPGLSSRVEWVDSNSPGVDLWLCARATRLELLDAQTSPDMRAPGVDLPTRSDSSNALSEAVADALFRAARVASVLRVAQTSGAGRAMDVKAWVRDRPGVGQLACDQLHSGEPLLASTAYKPGAMMTLSEGDCLSLTLHNTSQTPVDLTVFLIDTGFGMSVLWPDSQQMFNPRVESGGKVVIGEFEAYADSLGKERLLVLAVPVLQPAQPVSLAFLAQDSIDNSVRTRGQLDPFTALMIDAGFGDVATRSLRPARGGGQPMSALLFGLHVRPD